MFVSRRNIFHKVIESNRNLIVNGDISSGKTSNIIFPLIDKIIYNDENYLFLDSKEEYINKYYGYLKNKDYNIIIINLQEPDRTDSFNILDYPYSLYNQKEYDKSIEYLETITQNIFFEKPDSSTFLDSSCCDLFIGLSLLLFENATKEEINLNSVSSLVDAPNLKEYLMKLRRTSKIYNCLSGTLLSPDDTKRNIISNFKRRIRKIIAKDKICNMLAKTNIDVNKINTEKTAIFIIARDDNKEINIIASIIIDQLFKIIFDNNNHQKYNFIIENIHTINNINNLSNMLSSGIARNIKFVIGTRSLDEFNKKYSEYIEKLCNIISINSNNVETMIDNKYEKVRYSLSIYNYPKDTINYPIISNNTIKIFNLTNSGQPNKKETEKEVKKEQSAKKNHIFNEKEDNIFSVYEDNKIKYSNNKEEVDSLIEKIEAKIKELSQSQEEPSSNKDNNNNKEKEILNKKDNKNKENKTYFFEEKTKDTNINVITHDTTTEDLLKMIDEKIIELTSKEEQEHKQVMREKPSFNNEIFPRLNNNLTFNNIIPDNKNIQKVKKKRVKNKLAHHKNQIDIEKELEEDLKKLGLIKNIDGKKYYMNGYNKKKEELLKNKYHLEPQKNIIF